MLYSETVEPATLDVLKKLMPIPELTHFALAGGTALSLFYGHRKSIDIDLFSSEDFSNELIATTLEKEFPNFSYGNLTNPIGLFGFIGNLKTDFVKHHHHPLIDNTNTIDTIRFLSIPDISAMKISAILRRGSKKDFWDLAELLHHFSIKEIISFYEKKYPTQQLLISVPQAMTYFDDAEDSEDPISLKGQTWKSVKKTLQKAVSDFLR